MPFGRRKKDADFSVHPETKYRGVLYTANRRPAQDDLPPISRRERKKQKGAPLRLGRFGAAFHKPQKAVQAEPLYQGAGTGRVLRSAKQTPNRNGFFQDKILRTTFLVCIAAVVVSFITVQTTFAKPGVPIILIDNGRELECETTARTVEEFLTDNAVTLQEEDVLSTELSAPIYEGQTITIYRAVPVTVKSNGTETQVNIVAGHTVQDALDKAGIVPAPDDEIYPSPDTLVRSGMVIDHIVVTTQETTEDQPIPFDNTTKEDPDLDKGKHEIVQEGQEGVKRITYKQLYKNGILISQEAVSEEVIQEPVDQIMAIGTYVEPEKPKKSSSSSSSKGSSSSGSSSSGSSSSGGSSSGGSSDADLDGSKGRKVQLTAYCSYCNSGSTTSMGIYPTAGRTVACNFLPLGTRIYIEGYGEYVVEDRGGMGGNVIDIYMGEQPNDDACNAFGRKYNVTVYVIG